MIKTHKKRKNEIISIKRKKFENAKHYNRDRERLNKRINQKKKIIINIFNNINDKNVNNQKDNIDDIINNDNNIDEISNDFFIFVKSI